ncbi:plasmid maintenance system antidote protein [Chryseobacterium shandongense]|uniref:Plasmid maintenance system antidote protein n=1 Tax=Chryseobacterium shandongense TaxID=1493872 RepID=A0AAD1DPD1_9FLAO|nr:MULTISPECIES: plasmid maintenance system antidote protein [Chryseobacterium]AZA88549.1 plasmid maintenance system antidote protein [Chryseobacterium shandongense]AZA97091.1 plasmid maintenance system antidote protein [Chryseobacterium shandongense]OCK52060.1 plasmid maintenance system antidote protein [Chryseobacterium sp. CBo1]
MNSQLIKYKGIHPGIILERELQKRSLKKRPFALAVGEYPQTFNDITKGKRNIPVSLALKIEKELQLEEGTIVLLQSYYEIQKEKEKIQNRIPNLSILRNSLFWDTDINQIDWDKQFHAVIHRVFERGNEEERKEISRFYGQQKINTALHSKKTKPMQLYKIS